MTDESLKRCSTCKTVKARSEYYNDARTKDKLQRNCKECKTQEQKNRRAGKVKSRTLVKHMKVAKVAEGMAQGKSLTQAYKAVTTKPNSKHLAKTANDFWNSLEQDQIQFLRETLHVESRLDQINQYLDEVLGGLRECTPSEKKDAIAVLAKLTDLAAPDKVETTNRLIPEEDRKQTMVQVVRLLEDKDGNDE